MKRAKRLVMRELVANHRKHERGGHGTDLGRFQRGKEILGDRGLIHFRPFWRENWVRIGV